MSRRFITVLLLCGTSPIIAQTPAMPMMMPTQSMKADGSMPPNLQRATMPMCSTDSKTTREQRDVVLQVEIDALGHVTGAKALSGLAELQSQAIETVKAWEFKPFEQDGKPVAKSLKIPGPFCVEMSMDPEDQRVASVFFPLFMSCTALAGQTTDPPERVHVCGQAAEHAQGFAEGSRFVERRSAYVAYAGALLHNKQYADALAWAERAVALIKQGHDDDSGSAEVYSTKASAEAWLNDFVDASADYEEAEQFERAMLASPVGEGHKAAYSKNLKDILTAHAQVLSTLNRMSDRDAKLEEAEKL